MDKQAYEQIGVAVTCRSYAEYERMFVLNDACMSRGPILDVAGGAASFTAEAFRRGYDAYAADPQYASDASELREKGLREIETSTAKLAGLQDQLDWTYYGDLTRHKACREQSLELFIEHKSADEDKGTPKRYVPGVLPQLPFPDGTFGLVLCSHFLFLYADQFDFDFHVRAIRELMRVCRPGGEIRIYPLSSLRWEPYPRLEELLEQLRVSGAEVEQLASELPFIPGSSTLLRIGIPE